MAIPASAADAKRSILVLREYKLRNTTDGMGRRFQEFLQKTWVPAAKRAGSGPIGVFGNLLGPDGPSITTLNSYPGLAAMETASEKLAADQEFVKDRQAFASGPLGYVRYETTLLRGFPSFPAIEVPKSESGRAARIFELRVYESNNNVTLARKIRMFDEGEIDLFRKVGMVPVFFGETIAGRNMPNLTYMVGFDSLAAREKTWSEFGGHPEWKKMLQQPGVSDGEIVSNISSSILRPLPFSEIR